MRDDSIPDKRGEDASEFAALQTVIGALVPLSEEARRRILGSAATFLKAWSEPTSLAVGGGGNSPGDVRSRSTSDLGTPSFSDNALMSPKDFLLEKLPRTDVERIACLAYYLTHYRGTPHFKTLDLSTLNMEAAQPKFANAANSTNNAVKMGYLVPSTKGQRQLSAFGERFVRALPDRDAARVSLDAFRRRPRGRKARMSTRAEET